MARQEGTCWSCEAAWDYRRPARRNAERVIPGALAPRGEGSRRIGAQIAAVQ
jgi:hypothetical protein